MDKEKVKLIYFMTTTYDNLENINNSIKVFLLQEIFQEII